MSHRFVLAFATEKFEFICSVLTFSLTSDEFLRLFSQTMECGNFVIAAYSRDRHVKMRKRTEKPRYTICFTSVSLFADMR